MNRQNQDLDEVFRHPEPILKAMREAYHDAIRQHRATGVPMVFWENGKIIRVPADQVECDDLPPHGPAGP